MPLLMSSTSRRWRTGTHLLDRAGPRRQPTRDRAPLQARRRRLRPLQPRHHEGPPGAQAADGQPGAEPVHRGPRRSCSLGPASWASVQGAAEGRPPQHRARLLTGSAATSSTTTSRATSSRGISPRRRSSARWSARTRRGAASCSTTCSASTTASSGGVFHKGGNGGFTQVLRAPRRRTGGDPARGAGRVGATRDGRVQGPAGGRLEFDAPVVVSALIRGGRSPSWSTPGSCPLTSWTRSGGSGSREHLGEGELRCSTGCRSSWPSPAARITSAGSRTSARR